jgi:hypothetical protein
MGDRAIGAEGVGLSTAPIGVMSRHCGGAEIGLALVDGSKADGS